MNVYQWLCLLGIPGLVVAGAGLIVNQYHQLKAVKLGLQAILRDRLLQAYEFYARRGFADYDEKANVVNLYEQYEALGPNGIMQRKHDAFLSLPDELN
jgi:hypothetical protein